MFDHASPSHWLCGWAERIRGTFSDPTQRINPQIDWMCVNPCAESNEALNALEPKYQVAVSKVRHCLTEIDSFTLPHLRHAGYLRLADVVMELAELACADNWNDLSQIIDPLPKLEVISSDWTQPLPKAEVRDLYGIGETQFRTWLKSGKIPHCDNEKRTIRILLTEYERLIRR